MTKKKDKKSTQKKATQPSSQKARARDGIAIAGGVHAGGNVIMGDQYNDLRRQTEEVETRAQFVAQLQALQDRLAALEEEGALSPQQAEQVEVAKEGVQTAIEEAQKDQPVGARITATLTGAKAVLESVSGAVKEAVGLGAVLAGLIQIAAQLFGG